EGVHARPAARPRCAASRDAVARVRRAPRRAPSRRRRQPRTAAVDGHVLRALAAPAARLDPPRPARRHSRSDRLAGRVAFMKLSIIIPVYNEEQTISTVVERVRAVDLGAIEKEIIVANDGSDDGTQ